MMASERPEITLKEIGDSYVDLRGNSWSRNKFSRDEASVFSKSLFSCFDCRDSKSCQFCIECSECVNCTWCFNCERCHECSGCEGQSEKDHRMNGLPGSFYYQSAIVRDAFGYYWDSNSNIWDKKMFTFSAANRAAERTSRSECRNLSLEVSDAISTISECDRRVKCGLDFECVKCTVSG